MLPQCLYSCKLEFLPLGLTEARQDPKKKFHNLLYPDLRRKIERKEEKKKLGKGGKKVGKGCFQLGKKRPNESFV